MRQHCPTAAAATDNSQTPAAAYTPAGAAFSPLGSCGQTAFDFSQSGLDPQQLVRTLDLVDWGHTAKQTGAVAALAWAPDNRAVAVGYRRQGLVVWTPSGCRLLCTLRQPAPETPASGRASAVSPFTPNSNSSSVARPQSTGSVDAPAAAASANGVLASGSTGGAGTRLQHPAVVSVDGSVLCLAWGIHGYQLLLAGLVSPQSSGNSHPAGSSNGSIMYELSLAKSLRHHHRVTHASAADGGSGSGVAQVGEELHVLQVGGKHASLVSSMVLQYCVCTVFLRLQLLPSEYAVTFTVCVYVCACFLLPADCNKQGSLQAAG